MRMKTNETSSNLIILVMDVLDLIHTNYNRELTCFCY